MKTEVYEIKEINEKTDTELDKAAGVIKNGGLVAFPTETVYGLGANALDAKAVGKIYLAKGRPSDNPLIVHITELKTLETLTDSDLRDVQILAEKFWPGPLTVVLPKKPEVPDITTGGLKTVAVRMPDDKVALTLIKKAGVPIAAPSANLSGRPSPTRGDHVVADLFGRVDIIIKGEDCKIGIESTVLDMTGEIPIILRPGIITPEQISEALGKKVAVDAANLDSDLKPRAPGMKYTHYAPEAEMIILQGSPDEVEKEMSRKKLEREQSGGKVGLIQFRGKSYEEAARDFFARLRELDDEGVDLILAGALDSGNSIGMALMNRMLKAAGYKVINL